MQKSAEFGTNLQFKQKAAISFKEELKQMQEPKLREDVLIIVEENKSSFMDDYK